MGLIWAAAGTLFTWLMTVLGAAVVFFFRRTPGSGLQRMFLGFAAGVMVAASVWSLLLPALEAAEAFTIPSWLCAASGMLLGVIFLGGLDALLPHLRRLRGSTACGGEALLMTAITLHNIPEGMAVGLAFALAAHGEGGLAAATALALGIGVQNFPEGAAISLPLRQSGRSRLASFIGGALSGIVEPVFGVMVVLAAGTVRPMMPWLLSFAAGAMLYVVAEELIPQAHKEGSVRGTVGFVAGFLIMMILDVALG